MRLGDHDAASREQASGFKSVTGSNGVTRASTRTRSKVVCEAGSRVLG